MCVYKQKWFLQFVTVAPFPLGKPAPFSSDPGSYLGKRGTERELMLVQNPRLVCGWSSKAWTPDAVD